VRVLLDTQCWLWWVNEPERLGGRASSIIESPENEILVSVASSWEIAIKCAIGKLKLPLPPEEYVLSRLRKCGFSSLRIEHIHALRVARLPFHHSDPFDRLLISQSQVEKLPIITSDKKFPQYDIEVIEAGK